MDSSPAELQIDIVITSSFSTKPGMGDEMETLLGKILAHVKQNEPGTLECSIARNGSTESFVTWERFKDTDALKVHSQSPFLAELMNSGLLEKIEPQAGIQISPSKGLPQIGSSGTLEVAGPSAAGRVSLLEGGSEDERMRAIEEEQCQAANKANLAFLIQTQNLQGA
ncbi:unnamed protein product [Mycena citricolor]|uniref:ABM domain-containing protein n=1 Tax=Mycena citricolor TaxID=2018698 RepID=A0AAD2K4I7_9AGAR|nr:unnamed protein product [Mycena citricolor]